MQKKVSIFASAIERGCLENDFIGALVQLVRISACHAGGHGFESRTHRKREASRLLFLFYAGSLTRSPVGLGFFLRFAMVAFFFSQDNGTLNFFYLLCSIYKIFITIDIL